MTVSTASRRVLGHGHPTGSRRWSGEWGTPGDPPPPAVSVLVPTADRPAELATTLAGLAGQDDPPFEVVVSDQSRGDPSWSAPAARAMARVLQAQGRPVRVLRHRPRRGLAEHREHLLGLASAPEVLFLDDDVWLEPGTLERMHEALVSLGCGFVGSAVQGLSYLGDHRPDEEEPFEPWDGPVEPETVTRSSPAFRRWSLHNAANLAHVAARLHLEPGTAVPYRVAWVGGCVLYRRDALLQAGGFGFARWLPPDHVGEDVLAQWQVMERDGGAGLVPSGAVHLEAPTTVPDRSANAPDVLDDDQQTTGGDRALREDGEEG